MLLIVYFKDICTFSIKGNIEFHNSVVMFICYGETILH